MQRERAGPRPHGGQGVRRQEERRERGARDPLEYVGAYEFRSTEDPNLITLVNVTLKGDELFVDVGGKDPQPIIPLSNTLFSAVGGRLEFVADDKGVGDARVFRAVEGDIKAVRK